MPATRQKTPHSSAPKGPTAAELKRQAAQAKQEQYDAAYGTVDRHLSTAEAGHSQGQTEDAAKLLTADDLRELITLHIPADSGMGGTAGNKSALVAKVVQWVAVRGQYQKPDPKKGKAKKAKPDPEQAWQDLTDFLAAFSSEETTGQEMPDLRARFAELCDRLPAGKSGDDKGIPTLRNMVEAINLRMKDDESTLPVSGPKVKLMERIGVYFGLIDPPAAKKAVSWQRLAEFSDADLTAELERRRLAASPVTPMLIAAGIC